MSAHGGKTNEAFWWFLFSGGGVLSGMFIPVFIVLTGFVLPFVIAGDAARVERLRGLVGWWPVRVVLAGVLTLTFFHCAHRVRHVFMDFGMHAASGALAVVWYGAALAGTIATVVVLMRL